MCLLDVSLKRVFSIFRRSGSISCCKLPPNRTRSPDDAEHPFKRNVEKTFLLDDAKNNYHLNDGLDVGDRLFVADLETSGRLHSAAVKSDIYSYKFDFRGAVSKSILRSKCTTDIGVSHGDDTIYILKTELDTLSTKTDRHMSQVLLDMVISMMKTGKPNITSDWQPLSKSLKEPYTQLKILGPTNFEMEFVQETGRRSFWDNLPFLENHSLVTTFKEEL